MAGSTLTPLVNPASILTPYSSAAVAGMRGIVGVSSRGHVALWVVVREELSIFPSLPFPVLAPSASVVPAPSSVSDERSESKF